MSAGPAVTGTPATRSVGGWRAVRLGPLGRRLLLAFVLVAGVAVALVAGAGLVGSSLGLASNDSGTRQALAERLAGRAAYAYRQAGGWDGADLAPVRAAADLAGLPALVLDAAGNPLIGPGGQDGTAGMMGGTGGMRGMGGPGAGDHRSSAPVLVGGATVGTVTVLGGPSSTGTGRQVAWGWILVAAGGSLLAALGAGWWVVRALTRPLADLTDATRRFGAGDANARPALRGVGELAELADAFDQAADAVQRADLSRRRLTADVAHELRTPLSALQAGLEELRDGLVPPDPDTLSRLHDQSLRLGRTVQQLAQLSAADAAAAELQVGPVDLAALVREVLAEQAAQLRAAGLEVAARLPGTVLVAADADRLRTVVANLLDNCARYCRPGDQVEVEVAPTGASVRLTVRDNGPGIPEADLPHVRDRFWRGRDRSTVSGSGIGLAVVDALVQAHHGTLGIGAAEGGGTRVTVDLPPLQPPAPLPVRSRVS